MGKNQAKLAKMQHIKTIAIKAISVETSIEIDVSTITAYAHSS